MVNGKQKGASFEREICKELSLWISDGIRDDVFWRSAMSGGRATVGFKKGIVRKTQGGDISAIDPIGNKLTNKYVIECKHYRNIHLESLLFGVPKNNSIYEFWITLNEQAKQLKKDPMLIIKQNNLQKLLGLKYESRHSENFRKIIQDDYGIEPIAIFKNIIPSCYLYELKYVLNMVDPAVLES